MYVWFVTVRPKHLMFDTFSKDRSPAFMTSNYRRSGIFFKAYLKRSAILSDLTSEWNLNFFVTKRNSTKPKWRNVWRSKAQTLELRNRTFTGSWSSPTPRRLFPSQFCSADLEPGRRQISHSFAGVCMNLPGFTSRFSLCIRLGYFRGADTWQCKNSPPALMNWTHLSYKRPSES